MRHLAQARLHAVVHLLHVAQHESGARGVFHRADARPRCKDYFRPNLFANTPDILHEFLQQGGPPAFRIRLVLAATLGATYGIYSGFEIGENRPGGRRLRGVSQLGEISDSAIGDFDGAGQHQRPHRAGEHTSARRSPRCNATTGLRFHLTTSDRLIAYSKTAPDGPRQLFVVVSLDPHAPRDGWVCLALPDDPVPDSDTYVVCDLLTDRIYTWHGRVELRAARSRIACAHLRRPASEAGDESACSRLDRSALVQGRHHL